MVNQEDVKNYEITNEEKNSQTENKDSNQEDSPAITSKEDDEEMGGDAHNGDEVAAADSQDSVIDGSRKHHPHVQGASGGHLRHQHRHFVNNNNDLDPTLQSLRTDLT